MRRVHDEVHVTPRISCTQIAERTEELERLASELEEAREQVLMRLLS